MAWVAYVGVGPVLADCEQSRREPEATTQGLNLTCDRHPLSEREPRSRVEAGSIALQQGSQWPLLRDAALDQSFDVGTEQHGQDIGLNRSDIPI